MCGIGGYVGPEWPGLLDEMIGGIRSRGPDGMGTLTSGDVHLCHTRLAILDLSDAGAQPMERLSGRIAVSYNGEIYNYAELRADIEARGYRFMGHSDTELLPLGYAAFGPQFFERLNGMFAFALHDREQRKLFLVRDHFGIKPLYYALFPGGLAFSSSAAAVALHPQVDDGIDETALRDFLQFRYIPDGRPIIRGVRLLPPGHQLSWADGQALVQPYWTPGERRTASPSLDRICEELDALLDDSIRQQLRSDVPVGVFLSGGVDSSAVMHYAARHCPVPPMGITFAMNGRLDESALAATICQRLGAEQMVVRMDDAQGLEALPRVIAAMDAPVGDAIVLALFLLCQEAAKRVKVVLTGEGADEFFGGYVHLPILRKLGSAQRVWPLLKLAAAVVRRTPVGLLDNLFHYPASLGREGRAKVADLLSLARHSDLAEREATSVISDREIAAHTHLAPNRRRKPADLSLDGLLDQGIRTWLPNNILSKMDQLSMAHGLEARVPFVDKRIYELLQDVPYALYRGKGTNKFLLREVMRRRGFPDSQRKKAPFHLPVEALYKQSFSKLCDHWLSPEMVARHGVLKQAFVETSRNGLVDGEFLSSKRLVAMATMHMWLENWTNRRRYGAENS